MEALNRSQNILETLELAFRRTQSEHNFRALQLLQCILQARRELDKPNFVARFANEHDMEVTLRIALVQGLTCRTEITRQYVWHYYDGEYLEAPLPHFGSAWSFYEALDCSRTKVPGYFLIPPRDSTEKAEWVEMLVRFHFFFFSPAPANGY